MDENTNMRAYAFRASGVLTRLILLQNILKVDKDKAY